MSKVISVVYFSGYGHTKAVAEVVARAANANAIEISSEGLLDENGWKKLNESDAIIFGAPTYMGSAPWQFKRFADDTSKIWLNQSWKNKIFAGFTNSAALNGDKFNTLQQFQALALQHAGIWVGLGILTASLKNSTRSDINNLGGFSGLLVQSPADAGAEAIPSGDLETAKKFAERVRDVTEKFIA